ncbi:WG repeat-containing protein [Listeria farberi]|uniref:WG repeat-containing protein n=1 Tax=Listeria farberi TaxID=2713500 RepID=A0A7X1DEG7_9LIST|nr:WG repeat-containing protein [Listeria farberi]MBC2287316.1 WG repeat-containing protein [Listeria farberi]
MNKLANIPHETCVEGNNGFFFLERTIEDTTLWAIFKEDGTQITPFIYNELRPYDFGYAVGEIDKKFIKSKCYISEHEEPAVGDALIYNEKDAYRSQVECFIDEQGSVLNNSYYKNILPITLDGYRVFEIEYNLGRAGVDLRAGFLRPDGVLITPQFNQIEYNYAENRKKHVLVSEGVIRANSLERVPREEYGTYVNCYGLIDTDGNWISQPKYHHLTEFKNGIAKFYQNYKESGYLFDWGYIDGKGTEYTAIYADGKVQMRDSEGTLGPVEKPGDIIDIYDPIRFLFENGLYGYINSDGNVIVEPHYEGAVYSFWNGLAFVKKDGLWGFINEEGTPVTDFMFDHAGFISPGYAQGLIGEEMYLIGVQGIIAKKKKGYFGYRKKLTNHKTKETRYSCGFFPQMAFDKMYFYDSVEWVFIDEFDYQIQDKRPKFNSQFPAIHEYTHRADFLIHHEPSDTYYFKTGNKYGVDIQGNTVLIADLKEVIEDIPEAKANKIYTNLQEIYHGKAIPALWKELLAKGWTWKMPTRGNADSPFSKGVIVWNTNKEDVEDFLGFFGGEYKVLSKKLLYLANADGTGAQYYYFIVDEDQPVENNPIVFIGTEGELDLVCSNLNEFLQLLSVDAVPRGTQPDDEELLCYFKDVDDEASSYIEYYVEWLITKNITPIVVSKDTVEYGKAIIEKANKTYGAPWKDFLETIIVD